MKDLILENIYDKLEQDFDYYDSKEFLIDVNIFEKEKGGDLQRCRILTIKQ